ncbi:hypothetical protein F5Y04DRAFT_94226 [Hypomontagnella monticulosa]|nr:hypothetical protein F5Y04DRAFT_94226 [Hypomontagnella monticulosa]
MCSKPDVAISHETRASSRLTRLNQTMPSDDSICEACLLLFLFLVKRYNMSSLSFGDIQALMTATGAQGSSLGESFTPYADIPDLQLVRDDRCTGSISEPRGIGYWYSAETNCHRGLSLATKSFAFPHYIPDFRVDYMYMERTKLHSVRPTSKFQLATWGAWKSKGSKWTCLITTADTIVDHVHGKGLESVVSDLGDDTRRMLGSHWVEFLYYICYLKLNDSRLIVRRAIETLDRLKYQNAADPTTGAAHACLMYMHHLDHHKALANDLVKHIIDFPSSWGVSGNPSQSEAIFDLCRSLKADIDEAHNEAKNTRAMIIEQRDLAQTQRLGFLTILATIYIPFQVVAAFFGMNTQEINNSAWPISTFIAAAVPLTFISVLLPLMALPLLDLLARLQALLLPLAISLSDLLARLEARIPPRLRVWLHSSRRRFLLFATLFTANLVLNIIWDIYGDAAGYPRIVGIVPPTITILWCLRLYLSLSPAGLLELIKHDLWDHSIADTLRFLLPPILLVFLAPVSHLILVSVSSPPFTELIPYGVVLLTFFLYFSTMTCRLGL